MVRFLSKPHPDFFVAKFNLEKLHNGQVEDVFNMLLKQRMICSMDIDMCYSCFDSEETCDLILRVLEYQFCIRIVHFNYIMDCDIKNDHLKEFREKVQKIRSIKEMK